MRAGAGCNSSCMIYMMGDCLNWSSLFITKHVSLVDFLRRFLKTRIRENSCEVVSECSSLIEDKRFRVCVCICVYTHTRTHTHTYTYTYTHTHTHIHISSIWYICVSWVPNKKGFQNWEYFVIAAENESQRVVREINQDIHAKESGQSYW